MTLEEKINADIKVTMLAKDQGKLEAVRGIKAAILLLKSSGKPVTEEEEIKAMQKMVKQRKEAAEIYTTQNRKDLADVELLQIAVIEAYLPKQMSEADIKAVVAQIITQVGASSPADMGKVMGVATKQLAGRADGRVVSALVKELLSHTL
ncbi:MAG: GatB/YqeY domain-containing protein [Bacteroidetes bacterium]|nr:MAG: GatB/YqeY domain-containing protein [Bacteroidota bacterium]